MIAAAAFKDIALSVSSGAAATAAVMSYLSVREARKARRALGLPMPVIQPIRAADGNLRIAIHNAGGGLAIGAVYLFSVGDAYVAGAVGLGFLDPGQRVLIHTSVSAKGAELRGVVACTDPFKNSYVWSEKREMKRLRRGARRRPWYGDVEQAMRVFHPDLKLGMQHPSHTEVISARAGDR